jgi:hypothetical protein
MARYVNNDIMTALGNHNASFPCSCTLPIVFSAKLGRNTLQVLDRAGIRFYNAVSRLANHKLGYFCLHSREFACPSK